MSSTAWETTLLHQLSAPATPVNVAKLDLWERAEGGLAPEGANNPFNTSLDSALYPHVPTTNIPVYPSLDIGLRETTRTLLGSSPSYGYAPIVANLRTSGPIDRFAQALMGSSWAGSRYQSPPGSPPTVIQQAAGGLLPNPAAGAGPLAPGVQPTATPAAATSSGPGILAGSLEELVIRALELVLGVLLLYLGAKQFGSALLPRAAGLLG